MRILVTGRPGSGKGTQSLRLSQALAVPHVSSGALIRAAIESSTGEGREARDYVERGQLVPELMVRKLVFARLATRDVRTRGFILDGYPRTLDQLGLLDAAIEPWRINVAIELVLPASVARARLLARARADDTSDVIERRLEAFELETMPMLARLRERSVIAPIDADRPIGEVTSDLLKLFRSQRLPLLELHDSVA